MDVLGHLQTAGRPLGLILLAVGVWALVRMIELGGSRPPCGEGSAGVALEQTDTDDSARESPISDKPRTRRDELPGGRTCGGVGCQARNEPEARYCRRCGRPLA